MGASERWLALATVAAGGVLMGWVPVCRPHSGLEPTVAARPVVGRYLH